MRAMSTNLSAFTARFGLGGYLFGLSAIRRQAKSAAVLICNQGVTGSSPVGGTDQNRHLAPVIRKFRITHVPIKSTSGGRCASVPRFPDLIAPPPEAGLELFSYFEGKEGR